MNAFIAGIVLGSGDTTKPTGKKFGPHGAYVLVREIDSK